MGARLNRCDPERVFAEMADPDTARVFAVGNLRERPIAILVDPRHIGIEEARHIDPLPARKSRGTAIDAMIPLLVMRFHETPASSRCARSSHLAALFKKCAATSE